MPPKKSSSDIEDFDEEIIEDDDVDDEEIERTNDEEDVDSEKEDSDNLGDDECIYELESSDDEETEEIRYDELEEPPIEEYKAVKDADRLTKPIMTRFEFTRLLSDRIKQLYEGAPPIIKVEQLQTKEDIALTELLSGMIPLKIKRDLPNGKCEIWKVRELKRDHLVDPVK